MSGYRIFIITGEESGDAIGASLMEDLREILSDVEFYGIGGDKMKSGGLNLIFDISHIAFMGFFDILKNLTRILKLINLTTQSIKKLKPDVIIAIDAQEFSKKILSKFPEFKRVLYVAPAAWAWRNWRAKYLKDYTDIVLTLFYFEENFFRKYGVNAYYVGHPLMKNTLLNKVDDVKNDNQFPITNICLLPGSREHEIDKLLPIFCDAMKILLQQYKFNIFIPTFKKYEKKIQEILNVKNIESLIIFDEEMKYDCFRMSELAIAASGTVTLELGLTKTPSIVTYKLNFFNAFFSKFLVHTKFVCLVNIILGRLVMPELLQKSCTAENIAKEARKILDRKSNQKEELEKFYSIMNKKIERKTAAYKIVELLQSDGENL